VHSGESLLNVRSRLIGNTLQEFTGDLLNKSNDKLFSGLFREVCLISRSKLLLLTQLPNSYQKKVRIGKSFDLLKS